MDKGRRKSAVGDERDIEVDGCTAYLITVGKFAGGEVLGNIHHHVNLMVMKHVESLWLSLFRRPIHKFVGNAVLCELT